MAGCSPDMAPDGRNVAMPRQIARFGVWVRGMYTSGCPSAFSCGSLSRHAVIVSWLSAICGLSWSPLAMMTPVTHWSSWIKPDAAALPGHQRGRSVEPSDVAGVLLIEAGCGQCRGLGAFPGRHIVGPWQRFAVRVQPAADEVQQQRLPQIGALADEHAQIAGPSDADRITLASLDARIPDGAGF